MRLDRQRRDLVETWVAVRTRDVTPVKGRYGLFDLTPILAPNDHLDRYIVAATPGTAGKTSSAARAASGRFSLFIQLLKVRYLDITTRAAVAERPDRANELHQVVVGIAPRLVERCCGGACALDGLRGCVPKRLFREIGQVSTCDVMTEHRDVAESRSTIELLGRKPCHPGAGEEVGNNLAGFGEGLDERLDCADRHLREVRVAVVDRIGSWRHDGCRKAPHAWDPGVSRGSFERRVLTHSL